jgi:hypothetical protein
MKKSILLLVLISIALLVLGITAVYIYQLVVPYNETNVLIDSRHMRQNVVRFNHNDVFSKNCETGMSYTFWCNISNWKYKYGTLKPILTKGPKTTRLGNIEMLQTNKSMPAIFLGNNSMGETGSDPNVMSEEPTMFFTFKELNINNPEYNEVYELTNIPLNKWFHIAVSIHSNDVELYMDGQLLKTIHFEHNLDFNTRKLNIGELGGFDGYISKLAAFPYAISATEVYRRFLSGYVIEEIDTDCLIDENENENENENTDSLITNNDLWENIPYVLTDEDVSSPEIILDGTDVVTVFSQPNFGGDSVTLSVGNYSVNDLAELGIKPETISGVVFEKEGFLLTLYSENEPVPTERKVDYLILRDTSDWNGALRRINNKTRSLKIEPDPNKDSLKVTLYENKNYKGWKLRLPVGKYTETDLRMYGFDSYLKFKSYTIDSDYQVRVYLKDFFVNEQNMLRDDNRNIDGLIESIVSLKIEPRDEEEVVACTFYEGKNYTGNSFKLSYGQHNMSELIKKGLSYDDTNFMFLLRSVVIPRGYNVLLYPQDEFQGIPQRLESSTSYIQGKLIHLSIIKSIKIVGADEPKFSLKKLLYKLESMIMGYDN